MIRRFAIAAGVLFASGAWAQSIGTLDDLQGAITINQGEQFIGALSGQTVNASDRVMAGDGGSAVVNYTDGCPLEIESGTLVTLPATSPCAGGVPLVQSIAPSGGAVVGAGAAGSGSTVKTIAWVAGGVLLAAGIYELVEDDDDTASP